MTPTNNDAAIVLEALVHQPRDWLEAKQALDRLAAAAERTDAADEAVTVLRANHETERRNWEHERELHEAGMRQRAKDLESAEKRHKESLERRDRIAAEQAERADRAEAALLVAQQERDEATGALEQQERMAEELAADVVRAEATITRLQNRLNKDSQDFEIQCLRETVRLREATNTRLREALEYIRDARMLEDDAHLENALDKAEALLAQDAEQKEPPPWTTLHDGVLDHIDAVAEARRLAQDAEQESA